MSLIDSATNTGVPVDSTLAGYIKDAGMEKKTEKNNNTLHGYQNIKIKQNCK